MTIESHVVTDGYVFCARMGKDVDLERCLRCRRLTDFELDTRRPWVQCEAPVAACKQVGGTGTL